MASRPADWFTAAEEVAVHTGRDGRLEGDHTPEPGPAGAPRLGEVFALVHLAEPERRAHAAYRPQNTLGGELLDVLI